jgi:hypothetical protein
MFQNGSRAAAGLLTRILASFASSHNVPQWWCTRMAAPLTRRSSGVAGHARNTRPTTMVDWANDGLCRRHRLTASDEDSDEDDVRACRYWHVLAGCS